MCIRDRYTPVQAGARITIYPHENGEGGGIFT
jgi:hypothetical protein